MLKRANALLHSLAGLRIESVLGTVAKPNYRQDEPVLEVKVARNGGDELVCRFSKPAGENHYVLKRSDVDHCFKVAEFTVDPTKETLRAQLVRSKAGENSSNGFELVVEEPDS